MYKALILSIAFFVQPPLVLAADDKQPNILLIAVDDMGYDTPTSFGGRIEGLTPNIDKLARRGMKFTQAYNVSSRCAPSRGSIMTGHYQDSYNSERGTGNTVVKSSVLTIPEYLAKKGYMTGLFGKDTHYRPIEKYNFDLVTPMAAMAVGRSPELYAKNINGFIDKATAEGRPFFISANTHDPHRPYAGTPGELKSLKRRFAQEIKKLADKPEFVVPPKVNKYSGTDRKAPGFIPDHEKVREEFGYYLNSSHRADQFVGAMIALLEEKDLLENTLVIFHSDNGMHWPYAKSNVYVASVKTPFVMYWKGKSVAQSTSDSLISTIDILPTILEASGIDVPKNLPGKSLLPLLTNPDTPHHSEVHATLNAKGDIKYEMRSVISPDYIYIYNKWVDGKALYHNGKYGGGIALEGFKEAAKTNAEAKARYEFFYNRSKEELYNVKSDPDALINLVGDEKSTAALQAMRLHMLAKLEASDDLFLENFKALLADEAKDAAKAPAKAPVLSMDFEDVAKDSPASKLLTHRNLSLAEGAGVEGTIGLRAKYVGYERGSERIVTHLFLPEPGLEFSLNYDVNFDKDFQFVKGGKLLGLGPKKHITGGKAIRPEGWSARVTFKDEGTIKLYSYHQDMKGQYGERGAKQKPFNFQRERYYAVSLHVKVNDPPEASNGFSRLYVNGKLLEQQENLRLRGTGGADTLINKFMFSSFHGGHRPKNAPRNEDGSYKTVYATFDNIEVYEGERIRSVIGQ